MVEAGMGIGMKAMVLLNDLMEGELKLTVINSSVIDLRLFTEDADTVEASLNRKNAKDLIEYLQAWLNTGSLSLQEKSDAL